MKRRLQLAERKTKPKIFMMDLWATVPYYTAYLSRALIDQGANVMVGSITYYLDTACFSSRGIKVDPGLIDFVGRYQLPKLPRRLLKLAEAIINLLTLVIRFAFSPPDVVHVQYLPMLRWQVPLDFWFLKFCQAKGAAVVLTVHDLMPHDTSSQYKAVFLKLYRRVDRIICHSDHIKARLQQEFEVPAEKIGVIPHGPFFYDLPTHDSTTTLRTFGVEDGQVLFLWQGIIFRYKGIDLLLRAWQQLEKTDDSTCLVIAGTGAPEILDQIRTQVETLGLKNVRLNFRFIATEELVALYRAADVVVYPYRAITTSGALATGLALGKTIVASDLPVFRELLTDRVNARLIDPEQSTVFATILADLALDVDQRELLANSVREMSFGDQTWRDIAVETSAVYARSLSKPSLT
jgi:glycosyltransferase involved in cell wall biosynthesis